MGYEGLEFLVYTYQGMGCDGFIFLMARHLGGSCLCLSVKVMSFTRRGIDHVEQVKANFCHF